MTRRDYVLLAAAIRRVVIEWENTEESGDDDSDEYVLKGIQRVTREIARTLKAENPRFNAEQFYAATEA